MAAAAAENFDFLKPLSELQKVGFDWLRKTIGVTPTPAAANPAAGKMPVGTVAILVVVGVVLIGVMVVVLRLLK